MAFNEQRTLKIRHSKRDKTWRIYSPSSPTGHLTNDFIAGRITFPEFIEELKERGFEVEDTFQLTVSRKEMVCQHDYAENGHVIFKKGYKYVISDDGDDFISIVDYDGFPHRFSKSLGEDLYVGHFFNNKRKGE